MTQVSRPSYLPPKSIAPRALEREESHWSLDPALVLEPSSAEEFLRSHRFTTKHIRSTLLSVGFNPDIENKGRLIGHNTRVALLSLLINDGLKREQNHFQADTRILASAAIWHDVGKYHQQIHDAIFPSSKRIPQEDEAWQVIRTHPAEGTKIPLNMSCMPSEEQTRVAEAILFHHERMDADGYHGKKPSETPPESHIIAVADAIDVILGRRAYAYHTDLAGTIAELKRCSGTQFRTEVVNAAEKTLNTQSGNLVIYKRPGLR